MFCQTESSGGGQKHIKYISLPLFCIVVNSTEKSSVLRKYIALKMKGKCLVTRSGGGIRCKTYVILPHKNKAQRSAKKRHFINSPLVSYLTSLLAYENKILFDSDKNRAETIELFFLNCILAPSS